MAAAIRVRTDYTSSDLRRLVRRCGDADQVRRVPRRFLVGFKASPSTLIYAKGGYTNLAVEAKYEGPDDSREFDNNADGFRLGAGVEHAFGPNAYGKVEYRYSNYNNIEHNAVDLARSIDLDRHQVVAGVGFRF